MSTSQKAIILIHSSSLFIFCLIFFSFPFYFLSVIYSVGVDKLLLWKFSSSFLFYIHFCYFISIPFVSVVSVEIYGRDERQLGIGFVRRKEYWILCTISRCSRKFMDEGSMVISRKIECMGQSVCSFRCFSGFDFGGWFWPTSLLIACLLLSALRIDFEV